MKKITDERLIMKNLKNVRIAFVVQTLGILAILFYEFLQGGTDQMRDNPLWLVFMFTVIVLAYLSMNISVDSERSTNTNRSFFISIAVIFIIAIAVCVLIANTPGFNLSNGALIGGIIFVCALIPSYYIYRLRKRREEDFEEDDE
jgi:quinol-cytochrome oxidoreductase complex cytochrome b subunit